GSQGERKWDNRTGQSLSGRKALIVGAGDIGQRVAEFLFPFGVQVYGVASSARAQEPFIEVTALSDMTRLLGEMDYVTNLLPNTPETHDLYDAKRIARSQPTAPFINAGRGVAAVAAAPGGAVRAGQPAGAVVAVRRQAPVPQPHPAPTP
ncbi:D-2-hydroxyacid dehydrogenase, partial [Pseudomonas syringae]